MHSKPILKIAMVDFWRGIQPKDKERYLSLFRHDYNVVEVRENPDLLLYSCFGVEHFEYENVPRLFICGENIVPDFNTCDYAIGTVKIQFANKSLWVPEAYYVSHFPSPESLTLSHDLAKRKFCSFIYSQDIMGAGSKLRREFCSMLMNTYKHVDCPGKILHNMESEKLSARNDGSSWHDSKISFLRDYKFNIAFENSSAPGYITEKLVDCYMANTVPIYWGSEGDVTPYPKESMICANDYPDLESLCARIKEVDENDELYFKILAANPFRPENKDYLPNFNLQIRQFINSIIENKSPIPRTDSPLTDAHRCHTYIVERNKFQYKIIRLISYYISKVIRKAKGLFRNFGTTSKKSRE